jgi:hypothetical protein
MTRNSRTTSKMVLGKVRLRDVLKSTKTIIEYIYDFGDSWEHRLTVMDIRAGEPGISYPRYVAGKWNGPPEDCGGIPGFYQMLDVIADPSHPDHAETKGRSDDFDPKVVDEASIKSALAHIANRRNTGGNRSKRKSAGPAS